MTPPVTESLTSEKEVSPLNPSPLARLLLACSEGITRWRTRKGLKGKWILRKRVNLSQCPNGLFGKMTVERTVAYQRRFEEILSLTPEVAAAPSLESLPEELRIRVRSVMEDAHRREGLSVLYLAVLVDQFLATEALAQKRYRHRWAEMVLHEEYLPPSVPAPEAFFYAARSWEP